MLNITAGQMRLLGEATDELFLQEVAARVGEHWPRRVERLGPQVLLARLRAVHRVALGCAIKERPDLLRLANMAMALDDDFTGKDFAWVHATLGDTRLRPGDRLDVLDEQVRDWLLERRMPS